MKLNTYIFKVVFSMICGAIWIYYRKQCHYIGLPKHSIKHAIIVSIWILLNYYEPLSLPIGLLILYSYGEYKKMNPENKKNLN